ncbi:MULTISPECIES: AAA family ATPase [Psychrobacillus]|uniref:AAA family ATPase n=1 Tax=Psychrobacillus faecigallinarum TaxID=2762235 RepID=A0ABR8RBF3_9BACI|nr:AAA family ATPase [Psychrobacillus faecigallinarum]MBD7945136.1 hypothetical protein [Psychrobacillus faecigallinarum]
MKIHILGASGSGTTTLAQVLSTVLHNTHLDTDDYFWLTKYTEIREVGERRYLLKEDLNKYESSILSGALCGWGDNFKSYFDLVIFLSIPPNIRLKRLEKREFERYGDEIYVGGAKHDQYKKFIEWASLYDYAGLEVRSKALHEQWMDSLNCPILRIEGDYSVEERVHLTMDFLRDNGSF